MIPAHYWIPCPRAPVGFIQGHHFANPFLAPPLVRGLQDFQVMVFLVVHKPDAMALCERA